MLIYICDVFKDTSDVKINSWAFRSTRWKLHNSKYPELSRNTMLEF